VGPRIAEMVERAGAIATGRKARMHCWRGGERSASVAWLLSRAGFSVHTLKGGYKSFRQHVLQAFSQPLKLQVIGGFTGSGKTPLLREMHSRGSQVIDLESLAAH